MLLPPRLYATPLAAAASLAASPCAAAASLATAPCATAPPPWTAVLPFALLLITIAVAPSWTPALWHHARRRAAVVAAMAAPTLLALLRTDPLALQHAAAEYAAFMALLGSLYVVAGNIVVRGALGGTPARNTAVLLAGACLASLLGTTGAAMLLLRPLLRANAGRPRQGHVLVFFIFVVGNIGGLLTPLGDPPLYLGYLRGVPLTWPLGLWPVWAAANLALAAAFYLLDRRVPVAAALPPTATRRLAGGVGIACMLGVVGLVAQGSTGWLPAGGAELGMLALAAIAHAATPARRRAENRFTWAPLVEVATVFAGIFVTMVPALALMAAHGPRLGLRAPWQFFWATGLLSGVLDNAPTYLTFSAAAASLCGTAPASLGALLQVPGGAALLRAISLGAVMMGALTYLGNGPNLMVRAVAEEAGVTMPSFCGYMAYSGAFLLPLLAAVGWLGLG